VICEGHPDIDPSRENYVHLKAEKEEKNPVSVKVLTDHHEFSDVKTNPVAFSFSKHIFNKFRTLWKYNEGWSVSEQLLTL